MIRRALL